MATLQKKTDLVTLPVGKGPVHARGIKRAGITTKRNVPAAMKTRASMFSGNPMDVIRTMRSGVTARIVPAMADRLNISQDLLFAALRLPKSTIKARISGSKALSSSEQDRFYRAEKSIAKAVAVFESEESGCRWMTSEISTLGNVTPLSLLDTEAGYELVLDTLGRIEYGVYA